MKRLLLSLLVLAPSASLVADMIYDPIANCFYSYPKTIDIDQEEYDDLFSDCCKIADNMTLKGKVKRSLNDILYHCSIHLKQIGTPTALRLLADLNKNTYYFGNGSVAGCIFG